MLESGFLASSGAVCTGSDFLKRNGLGSWEQLGAGEQGTFSEPWYHVWLESMLRFDIQSHQLHFACSFNLELELSGKAV